ncbi:A33 protein, partial [Trogon melanurus]|nr:A33 protein [Trogon melanurus]
SLTLDPDTAHPSLVLSEDLKGVRWEETRRPRPDHPKRFDSSRCVLANEVLAAGRRYWEVAVGAGGEAWAVGVAKESVKRKGRVKVNPAAGIWAVGRCGRRYQALTVPPVEVSVSSPEVVGVYVDHEAGRVGFYDAGRWEPIFTYPPQDFGGEKLLP